MTQQEADIVDHVRERLGGLVAYLALLGRGVGNQSRPEPAPTQVVAVVAPARKVTPR